MQEAKSELEKENKKFESKMLDVVEKEIDELMDKLRKLYGRMVDIADKARKIDELIRDVRGYDSYISEIIEKAEKLLEEFE